MCSTNKNAAPKGDTQNQNDNSIEYRVLQVLAHNKGHRVSRRRLAQQVGHEDRNVRDAVRRLRKEKGLPICITRDGSGYWYGTRDEYEQTVIADYISKICDMAETVRAFYDVPLEGQIAIEDTEEYSNVMFGTDFTESLNMLDQLIAHVKGER